MRRDDVITRLKETEPALRGFGVGALYLFGSHARDEAKSGSDVDVFVDPAPGRDFGFLPFMDAYATIQKAFGDAVEIGYSTRSGLSPYILGDVERGGGADFLMAASKSPRARLLHIRDEIEGVAMIVRGLSFAQYQGSYLHRRAVERAVQIVSEAAKALPPDYFAKYSSAPWSSIVGIGNILRHEYQRLDDKQLREIATVHLPKLQPIVAQMLTEIDA